MSVRIIDLTETASLQSGDFVAIDNGSQGTHKFDATKLGDIMGTNIAVSYSSASSYAVGQLCMYNGNLYQCNTAIGSGETWNPAHWTQVTVGVVLYDKVDKVAGKGLSTEDFTTALKNKLNGIEAGAEVNVQANWNETNTSSDAYIQNKPTDATQSSSGFMSAADKTKLDGIDTGAQVNVQANWNETDTSSDAYIQNKPTNATQSTDGFMSAADKLKLDGIEAGAEVNVLEGVKVDGVALVIDANKEVDIVGKANRSIIATEYNTATSYNAGDYVIYDQVLYKCIAPATGTWDGSKWEVAIIADDLARKANVDGLYENMTVGNAEQLVSSVYNEESVPYNFRTSGGSLEISDREIDEVVGGTVAWNQLNGKPNNIGSTTKNGVTATWNSDKTWTLNGTATESGGILIYYNGDTIPSGHKVLFGTSNYVHNHVGVYQNGYSTDVDAKLNANGGFTVVSGGANCVIFIFGNETYTNEVIRPQIFDLTQMFDTTIADYIYNLEQTTEGAGVAFFRKLFPADYYEYDEGSLKSVEGLTAHEMVGFNQWDEEWEVGSLNISTGQTLPSSSRIRSKNFIHVISGASYYFTYYGSTMAAKGLLICFYDANKNFVSGSWWLVTNNPFTVPSNVSYIKFSTGDGYGSTYNHDICINISDPDRNGEYEPYVKHSYPLDDSLTLRGVPKLDSSNRLYYDGDRYKSDGTVERRYGIVDLGTLSWGYDGNVPRFYSTGFNDVKPPADNSGTAQILCKKYITTYYNNINNLDKCICVTSTGSVSIKDTSYTDATSFKTAMSGVYLVYELAEPTTEQATPYQNPQIVDNWGTEEYVIVDTVTIPIPVGHDTKYMPNLRAKLEMAPNAPDGDGDYIVRQDSGVNTYVPLVIPNELPTMPTTDGTYRLQVVVSSGVPTLSWVSAT